MTGYAQQAGFVFFLFADKIAAKAVLYHNHRMIAILSNEAHADDVHFL